VNLATIPLIFMGGWTGYAIRQGAGLAIPLGFLKFSQSMEAEADFLGLQYLEPTRAIIASCLEPVFSILLAAALLGESVRSVQTLGIVLVLSAIVIVQLPGKGTAEQESVVVDPIE